MFRKAFVFALLSVAAAGPVSAAGVPAPDGTLSHSGFVRAIDPASATLTLEELGPWKGPGTRRIEVSMVLTPTTTVELRAARRRRGRPAGPAGTSSQG